MDRHQTDALSYLNSWSSTDTLGVHEEKQMSKYYSVDLIIML